jgi:RNA polymerase sigma-70 factor (ECF subfamily)
MTKDQHQITLEGLKQGKENVFKTVYESNRNKFLNYARKYHLSEDENIDIYQDAYVIFYDNIMNGKIKSFTSSISTYLFSIGKYLILNKIKKNKKKVDIDLSIVRDDEAVFESLDIENENISKRQALLLKYFETIGKQCQKLLTLFYYRGYTIKEIVEEGNYNNENVVKSQKSRCMKTLKERIKANTYI